ncbi:hydantoinase B/oxoprolinase family protein [Alphaproteobacteria bacterium]|nr:hydantoinase B/oxoprolinase family protein [Alphaproteobacteria bacterium]
MNKKKLIKSSLDKITQDIIWGKIQATADEMGIVQAKSSMSPVIYEVLDFACGLCDNIGEVIAVQNGITIFTGTFTDDVQIIIKKFKNLINEGDIFLLNDPHKSGTHLNDVSVIKPIFYKKNLLAFAISDAHWIDIGGSVPGSMSPQATEIYEEGLQLPGIKLFNKGMKQKDIEDIISSNVRFSKITIGDLNAAVAAVNIAEKRIKEVAHKYGKTILLSAFSHIKNTGEKIARNAIKKMNDGSYKAHDFIDGDGFTNKKIPINLNIKIKNDEIEFDFTGTSTQGDSPLKCGKGALFSMVKTVFKAIVDPHAPVNEGWFRPLKLTIPDGTVFSATYPKSTSWYFEVAGLAADLVWKGFAPISDSKLSAGSYTSLTATFFYGIDHRNNEPFMIVEPHSGGWGASKNADGTSGLIAILDGDTYNYSIELFESKFPVKCNQYKMNVDAGTGHGKYRGGFGLLREYEILNNSTSVYCNISKSEVKPWSLKGGLSGTNNFMLIKSKNKTKKVSRIPSTKLKKGDIVQIITGSGGGYGNPKERSESNIIDDLENQLITLPQAKKIYNFKGNKK